MRAGMAKYKPQEAAPAQSAAAAALQYSMAGAGQGAGAGHPRYVTLVTQRQEASC